MVAWEGAARSRLGASQGVRESPMKRNTLNFAASHDQRHNGQTVTGAQSIAGSMKLSEAAEVCGLMVEAVRERLKIPQDASADEQLGRPSAKQNFSMQQARERRGEPLADPKDD